MPSCPYCCYVVCGHVNISEHRGWAFEVPHGRVVLHPPLGIQSSTSVSAMALTWAVPFFPPVL